MMSVFAEEGRAESILSLAQAVARRHLRLACKEPLGGSRRGRAEGEIDNCPPCPLSLHPPVSLLHSDRSAARHPTVHEIVLRDSSRKLNGKL